MTTTAGVKRKAAVYARYSSIMQKETSIEGQRLLCQKLADAHGLKIVEVHKDSAKSGQSEAGRDGFAALMAGVRSKRRPFDVIIVEDLNRLSRDPADIQRFRKVCDYNKIAILTQKGWIKALDVAVQSLVNSIDKESRAINVRRGQALLLENGGVPGAPAYGYRVVPGKPGQHEIDPEQAKIVVRIFHEYGILERSPRDIAADLTREGIPTPASHRDRRYAGSTIWNSQAFVGGMYAKGILGNRKYIGEIDWNTHTTAENPDTLKKVKRPNPKNEHTKQLNPAMRIVSQELWDAAQKVRTKRAVKKFGPTGKVARRPVLARGNHLLSGLTRCGACNGHMRVAQTSRDGTSRIACAAAHQHGTCTHSKSYDLNKLMEGIRDGMVAHLTTDEAIDAALEAYRNEKKSGERNDSERKAVERRLNALNVEIARLVEATMKLANPPEAFYKKIDAKEAERASLDERLHQLGGPSGGQNNVVPFVAAESPKFREVYRRSVMQVHRAITKHPEAPESRYALAALIDSIVVHPTGKRMPYEFTPYAKVAALMGLNLFPERRSSKEVLAEQAFLATPIAPSEGFPASSIMPITCATWSADAPIISG
ncbi:recombinase family protein [Bradyrhizobium sp. BRP23]|uniref:recombinase family protein n=1 Tax=Bradyrhizobium sp. BRP23 TaxID=2793820 RepID=UPI001CD643CC|nr:recombinase family protein [Bradyrhizobium sp. BRP23]MCA1419443.1 recombinase family protein [Bradyrhizobium sp. BRP23]